ncbi:MAG: tetratricopeptide repeat protein, partial [Bradyrhizobium sp.]
MRLLRPISILACCLMAATGASAQISLTPPAAQAPAPASKPAAKKAAPKEAPKEAAKPKAPTVAKKPAATPAATPTPTASPTPTFDDPNVDLVYGAYQRGLYKTALDLALTRAQYAGDAKAMTMIGELYSGALGVKRDYAKAAEWYQRAADGGDREGMFALAMMKLSGRGGPVNREQAVKLLASAAKLGNPKAAYNLALLYLDGQTLPQ